MNCDFCDQQGHEVPATVDGKTTLGPWAAMCPKHFAKYGIGLGVGKGQELPQEVTV